MKKISPLILATLLNGAISATLGLPPLFAKPAQSLDKNNGQATFSQNKSREKNEFIFCSYPKEISFNPFRPMDDYKIQEIFSLVLKSYIQEDGDGILEKWAFLPSENKLVATVSPKARWQDGKRVTAEEVALSIAKALTTKPLSKRVVVKGTETINQPSWKDRTYPGIKILSQGEVEKFSLVFESKIQIKNLWGVLKEELTPGALYNRMWPARLEYMNDDQYTEDRWDVVSKYPITYKNGRYYVHFQNIQIKLEYNSLCKGDVYIRLSLPHFENPNQFSHYYYPSTHYVFAVLNPNLLDTKEQRTNFANFLRGAFPLMGKNPEDFVQAKSIFMKNGAGHSGISWSKSVDFDVAAISQKVVLMIQPDKIKSPFVRILNHYAEKWGKSIEWVYEDHKLVDFEKKLHAFIRFDNTRYDNNQTWLLDFPENVYEENFLVKYPKTMGTIKKVSIESVPISQTDSSILIDLEKSFLDEMSVVPLAQKKRMFYARSSLPFQIEIDGNTEFTLRQQ